MEKLVTKDNNKPKKSALHWLIINAQTKEELDIAVDLTNQWRMAMMPITQATCQIWMEASVRLDYPDVFMRILMDRWNYRQLPVSYTLSKFIRHLGQKGEEHLDDAFRVFALYPFYGLEYDAQAYGALVEACCLVNTDEAWRRALIASEEGLSFKPKPLITLEALHALEKRSNEQGETEMASRYKSLASTLDLKPASKKSVEINADGDVIVKDHN
ncbi:hypothetical protein GGI12_003900 [Dipsacomyces acuminosporus]|nr:hypothetical protein GGI12_003900 [Dipsacomyces acuminosporus]